jgi:hypothetical protein
MSIAFDFALQLTLGVYAAGGGEAPPPPPPPPTLVRQAHQVAWGKTEVFVANATNWGFVRGSTVVHQAPWDLLRPRAWSHTTVWSLPLALRQEWRWGLRLESRVRLPYGEWRQHRVRTTYPYGDIRLARSQCRLGYGETTPHRGRATFPYGDRPLLRSRWRAPWTELTPLRASARMAYALTEPAHSRHRLDYAITEVNPAAGRLTTSWSLLADTSLQAISNTPELIWQEKVLKIAQATLSCDEDSPVWIARLELLDLGEFSGIAIGNAITLVLGLEVFQLIVDGKTLSRESIAARQLELTAVSPIALLDAPFAATTRWYQTEALAAHAAVEALIGTVGWQLPDWIIPAGRLLLEDVTPLAAARTIVAAVGGIVESTPEGDVICRKRHPISIPAYGNATVAHGLFDAEVIASRAQIAPSRGFNRVTLADEDGVGGVASDRIEYVADAEDPNQGTVRAWLGSPRTVLLAHTGHPDTVVTSLGAVTRVETETVEIIEGQGSTRYPVAALLTHTWQHSDLGDVTADGQTLQAATAGYSLLRITYTTTSIDWRVALARDEEVQFVLIDA